MAHAVVKYCFTMWQDLRRESPNTGFMVGGFRFVVVYLPTLKPFFFCMILSAVILLACAVTIYFACEFFVNGIEWLGHRLNMGQTATGTLLAAFGTALPESAVTGMAVIFGATAAQKNIGVGAALGGPLVLATISYAVVGVALCKHAKKLGRTSNAVQVNHAELRRDQFWFMIIFLIKIALGCVLFAHKAWFALLFLTAYAAYVYKELRTKKTDEDEGELEPLKLQPNAETPGWLPIIWQVTSAIAVIGLASHYFVGAMETLATGAGISPQLVALLLSPIATELPETMNAIIWVRQGKEKLALANISGAMMIQATIPSALGIGFTEWMFDAPLMLAGVITLIAIGWLFILFHRPSLRANALISVGWLYLLFAIATAALTL